MRILERYDRYLEYVGIFLTAVISFQYFYLWLFAQTSNVRQVEAMSLFLFFEVVLVHSSTLLSAVPRQYSREFLVLIFGASAIALNILVPPGNFWFLFIYLVFILNRMRFAFYSVRPDVRKRTANISVFSIFIGVLLVLLLNAFPSYISEFNLDSAYRGVVNLTDLPSFSKVVANYGHFFMCFGFLYFGFLSVFNLCLAGSIFVNVPEYRDRY